MPTSAPQPLLYGRSPLIEVVGSLCFPSILRVDADAPVKFQELVRKDFPFYERRPPAPQMSPMGAGVVLSFGHGAPTNSSSHVFYSADRRWHVLLSQRQLALSARDYAGWQDFRQRL